MSEPTYSHVNLAIALYPFKLESLKTFGPATVLYAFDEAFEPDLVKHICRIAKKTPTLKVIVSCKASKEPSLHKTIETLSGFKKSVFFFNGKKVGSKGSSLFHFYYRDVREEGNTESIDQPVEEPRLNVYLNAAWNCPADAREHYEEMARSFETMTAH